MVWSGSRSKVEKNSCVSGSQGERGSAPAMDEPARRIGWACKEGEGGGECERDEEGDREEAEDSSDAGEVFWLWWWRLSSSSSLSLSLSGRDGEASDHEEAGDPVEGEEPGEWRSREAVWEDAEDACCSQSRHASVPRKPIHATALTTMAMTAEEKNQWCIQ